MHDPGCRTCNLHISHTALMAAADLIMEQWATLEKSSTMSLVNAESERGYKAPTSGIKAEDKNPKMF